MQRVYGVKVLSVRSYVEQQKVTRQRPLGKPGYGPLRRPQSKKRMTIEMTEPFVWPEPPKDMSPYVFTRVNFFLSLLLLAFLLCRNGERSLLPLVLEPFELTISST